jgi:hypothetical protein
VTPTVPRGAWHAARFAVLVAATLLAAHDAVYVLRFGGGDAFAAGMDATGHGYWSGFTAMGFATGTALALTSLVTLRRLEARLEGAASRALPRTAESTYASELARLWPRLLLAVTAAYAVQEALEHLGVYGHPPTADELVAILSPGTVAVLAAVTFVVAALGAVVRWRIAVLRQRIEARRTGRVRSPALPGAPLHWAIAAALRRHALLLVRLDAGRAPPPPARA